MMVQAMGCVVPFPNTATVQFDRTKARDKVSVVRVLVVEDFAQFRQFVCSVLGNRQGLQVVGEASDGLEAVQKAVELKPDLVLMDIGLPYLNGIEAARQIRELIPDGKIIFLTQESSDVVVEQARSLGAQAYVVKVNAGIDLIPAIEAVISGRQFASGR
jgi:DNA-binding NarL/FixJ family response regulator